MVLHQEVGIAVRLEEKRPEILGCVALSAMPRIHSMKYRSFYLDCVLVAEAHRREGIGRDLLRWILKDHWNDVVEALISSDNVGSKALVKEFRFAEKAALGNLFRSGKSYARWVRPPLRGEPR